MSNWKDLAVEQPESRQLVLIKPADGSDRPSLGCVRKDSDGQLSLWDEHGDYHDGYAEMLEDGLTEGIILWSEIPED